MYLIDIIELNFTILLLNDEALVLPCEIADTESLSSLSRAYRFLHSSPCLVNSSQTITFHPFATTKPGSFVLIKHVFQNSSQSPSEYIK